MRHLSSLQVPDEKHRKTKKNHEKLGRNINNRKKQEKAGRNRKKQEEQEEKKKEEKRRRKNIHVPKMQHNTTQIFQLINTIDSFLTPYYDKNIFIKILR